MHFTSDERKVIKIILIIDLLIMVGYPVITLINGSFDWENTLYLEGLILLMILVFFLEIKSPPRNRRWR